MTAPRPMLMGLLILALFAAPLTVEAQQARVYHIGAILQGGPYFATIDGLRDGLRELGFEEGKQFALQVRDAKGDLKAVEAAARNLEGEKVDLIWALATSTTLGVKRATKSVPIVFYAGTDPVAVGLVASFRKPGGRLTGIYGHLSDLTAKRLELLKQMAPRIRRALALYNPDNPAAQRSAKMARDAARQLKVELIELRQARPTCSAGRQPRRPAGRTARQAPLGHQSQDRQGHRPHDPPICAGEGG